MFPSSISLSLEKDGDVGDEVGGGGGRSTSDRSLGGVNISCNASRGRMGVTLEAPPVASIVLRSVRA